MGRGRSARCGQPRSWQRELNRQPSQRGRGHLSVSRRNAGGRRHATGRVPLCDIRRVSPCVADDILVRVHDDGVGRNGANSDGDAWCDFHRHQGNHQIGPPILQIKPSRRQAVPDAPPGRRAWRFASAGQLLRTVSTNYCLWRCTSFRVVGRFPQKREDGLNRLLSPVSPLEAARRHWR